MPAGNSEPVERREDRKAQQDTLALLYQGLFTGIVRLQSGRQKLSDPVTFRRRIRDALQDAQRDATAAGYSARMIRDAESALVAFLDEAVLSLKDPARDAWAEQTLSVQLYGESNAGEVFFERLEEITGQTDSTQLADTLEVFLLCLLLGFEGRYSGPMRSEATRIAERLRSRIEVIRGSSDRLSPPFQFQDAPAAAVPTEKPDVTWRWWLIGSLAAPLVLFLLFKLNLILLTGEATGLLDRVR
jgi:type VI secretion system protein ImpK